MPDLGMNVKGVKAASARARETIRLDGRLADREQAAWLGPLGLGVTAAGLILLARIGMDTTPAVIGLWLAVSGVGQGLFLSPNSREVMTALPADRSGTASGLIATTRVVGQSLSVAIAGAVFTGLGGAAAGAALVAQQTIPPGALEVLNARFLHALHVALLVSAALAAMGAVTSLASRLRIRPRPVLPCLRLAPPAENPTVCTTEQTFVRQVSTNGT